MLKYSFYQPYRHGDAFMSLPKDSLLEIPVALSITFYI